MPELWQGVLIDFARLTGADDATLFATRGSNIVNWVSSSARFDELVTAFVKHEGALERTRRLLSKDHAGFVQDQDVFTPEELKEHPAFREILLPRGYSAGIATTILSPSGDTLVVHAEFGVGRRAASAAEVDRLDRLRPHFARAALLSARLDMQRAQAAAATLAMIGLPGAVLAPNGRMLASNDLLARLIPAVFQDRRARVTLQDAAADVLLSAAIDAAGAQHEVASIPIRACEELPPMVVHLVPVRGVAQDIFSRAGFVMVVTLVEPSRVPTASVVRGLFDLTPAEAKIATLIAAGHSPRQVAQSLGIKETTVRGALKQVFAKVGVGRQSALAALLHSAALP